MASLGIYKKKKKKENPSGIHIKKSILNFPIKSVGGVYP